jgi:quinol-cytochrome oxidoreductase complex cytochrome b subunit
LVIAILATVAIVALFVIAALVGASAFGGADPQSIDPQSLQDSPAFTGLALVGIGFLVCIILYFVGLVLGLVGIFQKRRKRLFAILGTVANGLAVLVVVSLLVLGAIGASVGAPQ